MEPNLILNAEMEFVLKIRNVPVVSIEKALNFFPQCQPFVLPKHRCGHMCWYEIANTKHWTPVPVVPGTSTSGSCSEKIYILFFWHLFWIKGIYSTRQMHKREKVWHFHKVDLLARVWLDQSRLSSLERQALDSCLVLLASSWSLRHSIILDVCFPAIPREDE